MLLLVGLGNPGAKFAGHRHNVGQMAIDAIHRRHGFPPWRRRFHAEISEGMLAGEKVLLLKPQTYMNNSGSAVGEAMRFYKLAPRDVIVIHDEVDLPPGKTRMKDGGGTAGHNGLRSIGGSIGDSFRRVRIGIGHPGVRDAVPHYVLHDFAKADREWLDPMLDAIAEYAPLLAEGKDQTFGNRLHTAITGDSGKRKGGASEDADANVSADPARPPASAEKAAAATPTAGRSEGPFARGLRRLFGGD